MGKKRGFKFPTVESAKAIPRFVPPVLLNNITPEILKLAAIEIIKKNAFAWMQCKSRIEVSNLVTQFNDIVYLPSQGGLSNNARSINPNHAWVAPGQASQVAAIALISAQVL